jgi:hypothetical protein
MRLRVLVVPLLLTLNCAGLTVMHVDPKDDAKYDGIRYYGTSAYVVVHTDGDGGLTADMKYLPDPAKLMSAHPYNYLASNTTSLTFTDGVLGLSESETDTTVVPKAILTALKDIAVAAVGAPDTAEGGDNRPPTIPVPKIFKIEVANGHAQLIGEDGVVLADKAIDGLHGTKE